MSKKYHAYVDLVYLWTHSTVEIKMFVFHFIWGKKIISYRINTSVNWVGQFTIFIYCKKRNNCSIPAQDYKKIILLNLFLIIRLNRNWDKSAEVAIYCIKSKGNVIRIDIQFNAHIQVFDLAKNKIARYKY